MEGRGKREVTHYKRTAFRYTVNIPYSESRLHRWLIYGRIEHSWNMEFIAAYVHSDPLRLRAYVRRPSLIRPSNIYGKVGWIVESLDLINELRSASIFRPSQGIYALERACTLSMMMEETDPFSFLDGLDFLAGTFLPPIHPPRREKFDREELNIGEGNSQ